MLPESVQKLAEKLRYLPGIGHRGSMKLSLDILQMSEDKFKELEVSLYEVRNKITFCSNCGFFAQVIADNKNELVSDTRASSGQKNLQFLTPLQATGHSATNNKVLCEICLNKNRHKNEICLVEKPTDVITIEKSQIYRGYYHVLNNLISPLDNVFAEDTNLSDLIDRRIPEMLETKSNNVEIILFFKLGFASQATTAYLKEILKQKGILDSVKISRLAQGLPMYYNPDTLDQATMAKALEDRREVD